MEAPKAAGGSSAGAAAGGSAAADAAEKPDVAAPANPDVTSCLDLVGAGSYEQAVPACTAALSADATNEKVKEALDTAKARIAAMNGQAAEGAADAAKDAAGAAGDAEGQAKDAMPAPAPKTY
ncbi:MAG: hypothetical protein ACHQ6T_11625 [Myxococcota bacterium]